MFFAAGSPLRRDAYSPARIIVDWRLSMTPDEFAELVGGATADGALLSSKNSFPKVSNCSSAGRTEWNDQDDVVVGLDIRHL